MTAEIRIGISGWTYAPWRGAFYPAKMIQKRELHYASRQVNAIEINGTFYRIQKPASFRQWAAETPDDFRFAIKASNFITHRRRLKDCAHPLANFLASGLMLLGDKLGPILWQLPPNLPHVDLRVEEFMKMLPKTWGEAVEVAAKHDAFVKTDEGVIDPGARRDEPFRHAIEFRHKSFADMDVVAEMRERGIALVIADSGEHELGIDEVTADHVYLRLHGQAEEYLEDGYTEDALQVLAKRVRAYAARPGVKLVSAFFDNDAKALAPRNAMRLSDILGLPRVVS